MDELEIPPPTSAAEPDSIPDPEAAAPQTVSIEEWMASSQPGIEEAPQAESLADTQLLAVLEACVYVAEEPLMPAQIAAALDEAPERIRALLDQLVAEFDRPEHGVSIREVAGGYKMATKPEHHDAVRNFVKSLKTPLKLSLPALETLAVIAYKQPVTTPEIMEIRGVQGGGVLKTLLDRKLITEGGRKNVIGKPILYKTTREFLIQFGLKDLSELPSLKEFEEIRRMSMPDGEVPAEVSAAEQAELSLEALAANSPAAVEEAEAATPATAGSQAEVPAAEVETADPDAPLSDSVPLGREPAPEVEAQSSAATETEAEAETATAPSPAEAPAALDPERETSSAIPQASSDPEASHGEIETPGSDAPALDSVAANPEPREEVPATPENSPPTESQDH